MQKKFIKFSFLSFSAISLLIFLFLLFFLYQGFLYNTVSVNKNNTTDLYRLNPGSSLKTVIYNLEDKNIINKPQGVLLSLYLRLNGADKKLHAGEYSLEPDLSIRNFFTKLVNGDVKQHAFTIIEGWTFYQLLYKLSLDKNIKNTIEDLSPDIIMNKLGAIDQHPEGRFFPDTYFFPNGTKDIDLLKTAYNKMELVLNTSWENRNKELKINNFKNKEDALILASIVERESNLVKERPKVAGVFLHRLKINMKLQADPTVIYGLGPEFKGDIKRRHLKDNNPYNTYVRYGLPPTPISLPSKSSIEAVMHPEITDKLYFVAVGDGSHYFSSNLKEHNKAVRKYQLGQ
jgi:UPF0755 protein